MTQLFQVKYEVAAVICAENETDAKILAIKQYQQIATDYQGNPIREVKVLPENHEWRDDYVPYGFNPKGLVLDQIERITRDL